MSSKKRILCLIESLGSGGAERQLSGLAVMLKEYGFDVQVGYYINNDFYLHYLTENEVETIFLSRARLPRNRFCVIKKQIVSFHPDTVISFSVSTSLITCFMKLLGAGFNLVVSERNTTQRVSIRERVKFFLYRWADSIVPNSQSQFDFISRFFPTLEKKTEVITNYVDVEKFFPLERVYSLNEYTRMICVGRLMPQKNLLSFIEVVRRVIKDGFNLIVDWYGQDLYDDYSVKVHNSINKYDLCNTFILHTPSSKIEEKYVLADVFCLPSLFEGFPNALCEAMSCGLPVLCSCVCDNHFIVQEGENGFLFDPVRIEDMVFTIERFLDLSINKRQEMGNKSREIAIKEFSKSSFLEKYLSIL